MGLRVFGADTAFEVLQSMKVHDWEAPGSTLDFKSNVSQRALVLGSHLLFWDATSFLLAGQNAGLWTVTFTLDEEVDGSCN